MVYMNEKRKSQYLDSGMFINKSPNRFGGEGLPAKSISILE